MLCPNENEFHESINIPSLLTNMINDFQYAKRELDNYKCSIDSIETKDQIMENN